MGKLGPDCRVWSAQEDNKPEDQAGLLASTGERRVRKCLGLHRSWELPFLLLKHFRNSQFAIMDKMHMISLLGRGKWINFFPSPL